MAQAGSAQREPSMEEILASIRRIIEDNDSGKKPDAPVGQAADAMDFEVERVANAVVEVDSFRAELQAAPARAETKPVSLADVQAQVAQSRPVADEFPQLEAGNDTGRAPMPAALRDDEPESVMTIQEPESVPAARAEPELPQEQPLRVEPARLEPQSPRPAILSEQAGRQVAAAFGELSEAFAARSKKTFDEMAEEMLRPMLQDWLDNNLPMLVERLVREEIERVARGAQ